MLASGCNSKRYVESNVLTYTGICVVCKEKELIKMELVAEFSFVR
jgi:hypothetical protein